MKTGNIILSAALAAGLAVAVCPTLSAAQAQPDCAARNSAAFFEAASAGDVRSCLQAGADPAARDEDGKTPFDFIAEDSPLIGTPAYWRLHQARYD